MSLEPMLYATDIKIMKTWCGQKKNNYGNWYKKLVIYQILIRTSISMSSVIFASYSWNTANTPPSTPHPNLLFMKK